MRQGRDDIDVAFISQDITGLSTKHELVPETCNCYDLMPRSRGLRWVHIQYAGADRRYIFMQALRGDDGDKIAECHEATFKFSKWATF